MKQETLGQVKKENEELMAMFKWEYKLFIYLWTGLIKI